MAEQSGAKRSGAANACGLDFGTSNSGVAIPRGDSIELALLEDGSSSMPSAVFFGTDEPHLTHFGRSAVNEYLDGTPGRLMRSLKSLLGSSLMEETTAVGDRNLAYSDIVTLYLRTLRARAAEATRTKLDSVVLGRPVRFVDDDAAADKRAQLTLAKCAQKAGFRHVEFQLEPIAAALDYERTIEREEAVLVIDVGGGTADFTVIRLSPERRALADRPQDILANDGIHIAGTDFDSRLNLSWVMPTLGYGTVGPKGREVPKLVYYDLSTWHRINLLYSQKFTTSLRELRDFFADAELYERLVHVIEDHLGHELLGRSEAAKIELGHTEHTTIDLSHIARGLVVEVNAPDLRALLADLLARLVDMGKATVATAGLTPATIATLYFTGGSSGMTALRAAFQTSFPDSRVVVGDLFGSVVSGLGIEAGRRFR